MISSYQEVLRYVQPLFIQGLGGLRTEYRASDNMVDWYRSDKGGAVTKYYILGKGHGVDGRGYTVPLPMGIDLNTVPLFDQVPARIIDTLCNGCGPQSWKALGHTWRWRWLALPTPGAKTICKRHDFDYIIGASIPEFHGANDRMRERIEQLARQKWYVPRRLLNFEAKEFHDFCEWEGAKRFHFADHRRTWRDLVQLFEDAIEARGPDAP